MKHTIDIRVYYEDTDAGGIIYHANYLKFGERGRTEFLRQTGHENRRIQYEKGVMFVVRHIDIDYLSPGFLDDFLQLETSISEMRNTSFIMHQRTIRPAEDGTVTVLADMRVALVCVDTKNLKPIRMPEDVKSSFQKYREDIE